MNLASMLQQRHQDDNPIRVGVIGAGKFGSMFLAQVQRTDGMHLLGLADLSVSRGREALARVDWPAERYAAASLDEALRSGRTCVTDDAEALIRANGLDVIVEATGNPAAGVRHARAAFNAGVHVVMVNVEADALAGPLLARGAAAAGVVYSMAYGDQPALICELVDWARTAGFQVVAAGKGTKYLPHYHASTPDTVWEHYGLTAEEARAGGMNPQMFNSFLDGTKSALEMAAVANAAGLTPPDEGLLFPPCGVDDLPHVLRPVDDGGRMPRKGIVEVVSSLERDGRPVFRDLRWGVYVVIEAPDAYVQRCFREYGLHTDSSGRYAAMYKPYHLIGLELGISVASVALRHEPTGRCAQWRGDVVATAKQDLAPGDRLDGEGGATVWGRLLPAMTSSRKRGLPIGLAHDMTLTRPVQAGELVTWEHVSHNPDDPTIRFRQAMEQKFRC